MPARRGSPLVEAISAEGSRTKVLGGEGDQIIAPQAKDRILELFDREQMPGDVRSNLAAAINGDLKAQSLMFQAMIDTWPRLQKGLREVKLAARKAPWKVEPYSTRGEEPEPSAEKLAKEVEASIWGMKPDPIRGLNGFESTVEALAEGYFLGHQVLEIHWCRAADGKIVPAHTRTLPPRFYNYPTHETGVDRLMLDRHGAWSATALEDFPPNRFLVAVNRGHSGHPSVSAPLRALAGYWLAAVYGLKWMMNFTQLFGIPFRWAEYADKGDKTAVAAMLRNIGTAGWGAFKAGTKLNFVETSKGGDKIPQRELIKLADEQCDIFILGQTLTSSVGDSGSRALGDVHQTVRQDLIAGICDFVGETLTHQLAASVVEINHGKERGEVPGIWARFDVPKDEKAMAERDEVLRRAFPELDWSADQIRKRHGIDVPADESDTLRSGANGAQGDPATGLEAPHETKPRLDGADASGKLSTPDKLSAAVLEGLTGVSRQWLGPVRPFFDRLAALAMSNTVTDEDFLAALEKARGELPELFEVLDTQALEEAFEEAIGSAMLAGSTEGLG